jgi:arylsulfatase A-like enzyme
VARPNVILIVADDMGYGDFGAFNDGNINTPNLDAMVESGTHMSQQYAGSPVCSPSRAALLTGRYPIRTGAVTPQEVLGYDRIGLDEATIADSFRASGYATGLVGKWHNGALDKRYHPNSRGFDEFVGFSGGWADYWDWRLDYNGKSVKSDGRYLTDVLTEEAVSFVSRHKDEPFFLMLAYNAPHVPLQAPEDLVESYRLKGLPEGVAITYAMIEVMDQGLGRLLQSVQDNGLTDGTLVMFTSDNGPAFRGGHDRTRPLDQPRDGIVLDLTRHNLGLRGQKGSVFEGGIRVPMVLQWPGGIPGGREVREFVHFVDWFPTLARICDVPIVGGRPLDGRDVWNEVLGEASGPSPPRFWQLNQYSPIGPYVNAAMRDGPWKLVRPTIPGMRLATERDEELERMYVEMDIRYKFQPEEVPEVPDWPEPDWIIPTPPAPELFNLDEDPLEERNLDLHYPGRLARMNNSLENWFEEVESERRRLL